jgi:hypothetical protein
VVRSDNVTEPYSRLPARGLDVRRHVATFGRRLRPHLTKILQGWPTLWATFRALIEIFSQIFGPRLAIWTNPVPFSLPAAGRPPTRGRGPGLRAANSGL